MTTDSTAQKRALAQSVERWWHSIDLGDGVVTDGHETPEYLAAELAALRLPQLDGRTVLDIGVWDGFYSFEAERLGASRVVALDTFSWALHFGTRGFDIAHEALASNVESIFGDFMSIDLASLGRFDVVLFLGAIYKQRHLLLALERLLRVTGGLAIIESHAAVYPGLEHVALCEFLEHDELAGDDTNWWIPNLTALIKLCRSAGFSVVEVTKGPPAELLNLPRAASPAQYRAILHARP
jgi:tRNA (mo5U34)-methyltransferase